MNEARMNIYDGIQNVVMKHDQLASLIWSTVRECETFIPVLDVIEAGIESNHIKEYRVYTRCYYFVSPDLSLALRDYLRSI